MRNNGSVPHSNKKYLCSNDIFNKGKYLNHFDINAKGKYKKIANHDSEWKNSGVLKGQS